MCPSCSQICIPIANQCCASASMGCVHILLGRDNNQEWGTVNNSNLGFEDIMCRACSAWHHSWLQSHGYFCYVQLLAPLPGLWAAHLQDATAEPVPHAAITLLWGCVLLLGACAALRVALGMPGLNLRHRFPVPIWEVMLVSGPRGHSQVWLSPVPPQCLPTLPMAQDPTSASQGCQPLPQWCCSRTALHLPCPQPVPQPVPVAREVLDVQDWGFPWWSLILGLIRLSLYCNIHSQWA